RDKGTSAFPEFTTLDISFPSMPTIAETSEEFLSQHCWHGGFKLKDVEGRIPIEPQRLKYWYSSDGPYRKCFVKIPMGDTRSLVYVDLEMLGAEFQAQWEKSQKG
ncbi:MAG: hypothetical protein ABSH53_18665, partial [Holophaga sp.]